MEERKMAESPKRRKCKDNPYTLNYIEEKNIYTITFKDVKGHLNKVEVSEEVYRVFDKFELQDIKETLFSFNTLNAEIFQQQISQIQSREEMLKIVKALRNAKELNNLIRFYGFEDLLEKIDFFKLGQLLREAQAHLDNLNFRDQLENSADTTNLLNVALEDIIFMFRKVSEEELILADQLKNQLRLTQIPQ